MWIQVRTIDGSQTRTIEDVSRKATIEELRERVWALFDVRPECQRLFYRGKQVRRPAGGQPGAPGRGRVSGCGARGPAAVRAPTTGAPSGSEGRGAWARETDGAGQPPPAERASSPGASLPALAGNRSQEGQAAGARGSHAGAPEGRAGILDNAESTKDSLRFPAPGSQIGDEKARRLPPVPSLEGCEHTEDSKDRRRLGPLFLVASVVRLGI